MDYQIAWSRSALQDLRDSLEFIARNNPKAAFRIGQRIVAKMELASRFPRSGPKVPEIGEDAIRESSLPPFRIVYELDDKRQLLTVLRIWHGARGRLPPEFLDY
jgi:plasmid stabilization system protein ParE